MATDTAILPRNVNLYIRLRAAEELRTPFTCQDDADRRLSGALASASSANRNDRGERPPQILTDLIMIDDPNHEQFLNRVAQYSQRDNSRPRIFWGWRADDASPVFDLTEILVQAHRLQRGWFNAASAMVIVFYLSLAFLILRTEGTYLPGIITVAVLGLMLALWLYGDYTGARAVADARQVGLNMAFVLMFWVILGGSGSMLANILGVASALGMFAYTIFYYLALRHERKAISVDGLRGEILRMRLLMTPEVARRIREGCCAVCGYLSTTGIERCPECGHSTVYVQL